MKIEIRHRCSDFQSYRAARVKSLFNVESGANWSLDAELAIDDPDWKIGVVVGPSGSGKTSIGRALGGIWAPSWPARSPIVDAIAPRGDFDTVTGALASVGLGAVPSWLRPYSALSNGERFRADLARLVCEAPARVVVDEFSSVVDRQIARVGALAFSKAWRRGRGQAVLLSCHYDILDWVSPDWVFDTGTGVFERGRLRRRPPIELELWETDWRYWPLFEPHHYLKLPKDDRSDVLRRRDRGRARGAHRGLHSPGPDRGAGLPARGHARMAGRRGRSGTLCGQSRARSVASIRASCERAGRPGHGGGFGGHFRAVQGFRYLGAA